jgi:endonuclease III
MVCEILKEEYGKPRFGNPDDPLDDLIYVILSNRTAPGVARRIYEDLKGRFDTWDELLTSSSVFEIIEFLKFAGLAAVKSQQIWAALEKIRWDFGSCDLSQLHDLPQEKAEEYLTSLPGVSLKVAKCVMMYTLNSEVLPVDSHVHRVTKRLGWNDRKRADQCHEELEALVAPDTRYALHVDCIAHGRAICRPAKPACQQCCVSQYCTYYRHAA